MLVRISSVTMLFDDWEKPLGLFWYLWEDFDNPLIVLSEPLGVLRVIGGPWTGLGGPWESLCILWGSLGPFVVRFTGSFWFQSGGGGIPVRSQEPLGGSSGSEQPSRELVGTFQKPCRIPRDLSRILRDTAFSAHGPRSCPKHSNAPTWIPRSVAFILM